MAHSTSKGYPLCYILKYHITYFEIQLFNPHLFNGFQIHWLTLTNHRIDVKQF